MNVIHEDPDLGQRVPVERREEMRRDAMASLVAVDAGESFPTDWLVAEAGGLGQLVLEGVIVRTISFKGRRGLELFGAGDLLGPSERTDEARAMVPAEALALTSTRFAVLDAGFTIRMCNYPAVITELTARLERRSSAHALRLTIMQQPQLSVRLRLLLWHLADRFGRVGPRGVLLPLPLSHELLAQLVGAQRPSVSRALKELERNDLVARRDDGTWWLGGEAPFSARRA